MYLTAIHLTPNKLFLLLRNYQISSPISDVKLNFDMVFEEVDSKFLLNIDILKVKHVYVSRP